MFDDDEDDTPEPCGTCDCDSCQCDYMYDDYRDSLLED